MQAAISNISSAQSPCCLLIRAFISSKSPKLWQHRWLSCQVSFSTKVFVCSGACSPRPLSEFVQNKWAAAVALGVNPIESPWERAVRGEALLGVRGIRARSTQDLTELSKVLNQIPPMLTLLKPEKPINHIYQAYLHLASGPWNICVTFRYLRWLLRHAPIFWPLPLFQEKQCFN